MLHVVMALSVGPFIGISAGDGFACGIDASNSAYCWGQDRSGVLGSPGVSTCGVAPCSPTAQLVPGGIKFKLISAGNEHVCAISLTNELYCWGSNSRGQLGIGAASVSMSYNPLLVDSRFHFDSLSAGALHTCARATDTTATFCWGDNSYQQLGNTFTETCLSSSTCSTRPIPIITSVAFRAVEAGLFTSCGLSDSLKVYCWGANYYLGWGNGDTSPGIRAVPKRIKSDSNFVALSTGAIHACAIQQWGQGWCWGNNTWAGTLGNGSGADSPRPVLVASGVLFQSVSASHGNSIYAHGCTLSTTGDAHCWGSNSAGQLGVAVAPSTCSVGPCAPTPVAVSGGLQFIVISAGRETTCGVGTSGKAWCWGRNEFGQLGDGSTTDSSTPVLVR